MCSRISALLMLMGIALITRVDECRGAAEYYGRYIGPLSRLFHSVSGDVYAVDARTIHIRDFTYDGEGPAAYFYAGNTKAVGPGGFIVRDETGSNGVLKKYNKKHVTVTLPEGKTLNNIRWISVWCEEFQVNFGDIQIPRGIDYPKPQKIGALSGVHGVSSENIVVVDAQTLLIPSFSYDGEAPDAKFWVGRGPKPSPQGIRVPDENGKQAPLRRYDRKTIVLTLPGELTIFDIGHFGVWCEAFTVDFGHLQIPPALNVPPSLKMLGVSPQSKLNCEVLSDDLAYEIRWAVAGDSIVIQLVAKLESGEYMSFGPSGDDNHSVMVGGDVVVAWVDQATLNGYAMDYYLDAKSQCSGTRGSCPDYRIELNTESVRLLNAALVNGYSIVTYQRPLKAHDGLDRPILTTKSQPIIWAVGPLNQKQEVSYHSITSKGDVFIDFGRPPKWNCPIPDNDAVPEKQDLEQHESIQNSRSPPQQQLTQADAKKESTTVAYRTPPTPAPAPKNNAWVIPPIQCNEPDDRVFYAQMGPTGGKQGYPAITGHVGWGISYYINGLLIPEIHVVRGYTYTFIVEGGMDPNIPAKFHPFYITDDPVGGYQYKTPEERRKVNIYAGAELNKHGEVVPTGLGRLCNWTPDPDHAADDYASFGAYQRTLTLVCDHGIPASIQWTPDKDTPDTVYYQCFVHRYLGWKIHVHDRCDLPSAAGSEPVPSVVLPGDQDELQANPSVFVTTRVKPEFPPQSIKYFEPKGKKNFTKSNFPYEIQKVSMPDFNEINSSVPEHVIPVKEEVEDIPDATTYRMTYTNMTLEPPTMPPVTHKNHNYRPDFSPPPLPQSAPSHHNQRHPNQRHPPVKTIMVRRPVHHFMKPPPPPNRNGGPPPPAMLHHSASQSRPVIVKKPLIRLPQRPGMMSPPPPNHMSQRPMQGPPPPPPPSRPPKPMYVHKFKKPHPTSHPEKSKHKMQPSPMISQKPEEGTTRMPIAVNTGFNPGSLVIESGFKPIINTPQVAEDRVSEVDYDDEEESVGVIKVEGSDDRKSQTEMFEPMFIPSPLDSNDKTKKMTTQPVKKIRKQVVHVRPVYNHDEPQFRSEQDDLSLQSSRKTPVLAYDGKTVAKDSVPGSPAGATQSEVTDVTELTKQPQYGPFKGDPPPPVPSVVLPSDIPQLNVQPAVGKEKEESVGDDEKNNVRERRSPHHEPGHLEDHDHDHHGHDHSAHSHNSTMTSSASLIVSSHLGLAIICVALMKYL